MLRAFFGVRGGGPVSSPAASITCPDTLTNQCRPSAVLQTPGCVTGWRRGGSSEVQKSAQLIVPREVTVVISFAEVFTPVPFRGEEGKCR